MTLRLRPATREDSPRLLAWRNDPVTREAAFNQEPVSEGTHAAWLERKLGDPRVALLIAEEDERPVGQVRLEAGEEREAEIHVALAPEARGRGLAAVAIAAAAREARGRLGAGTLLARVKDENEPSLRAFRTAGFVPAGQGEGFVELRLELPEA